MGTLPVPADTFSSEAVAVDPSGRYVLGSAIVRQATDSFPLLLWDRQRLVEVKPPLPRSVLVDVNSAGVVIGNARDEDGFLRHPWRYHAGKATLLPLIDEADQVTVEGINSRGDIVGIGRTPANTTYGLLWPASRPGTVRVLDTPADLVDLAGITDDGTVVGVSGFSEPTSWLRTPGGVVRTLAGPDNATGALASAVGGHWAVGQIFQGGVLVGLRWDLRTGRVKVLDPGLESAPTDVNASGVVLAGTTLQRGGTVVTLPAPSPGDGVGGAAIADNGTVVGFHNNLLTDEIRAVRWTGC
ncbi:hypothetical protein GCM10022251_80690 [Phytohabitans flavus]|uniref:Uncharacterized protein n=2 Tax=Phytohabitans flavus TaxID=1076124 RepID=A0A6F8XYL7_9ACTN|nr:hypothetical protein Pflav_052310 [Phytohabitans flavus]